jgi:hypothetical protein
VKSLSSKRHPLPKALKAETKAIGKVATVSSAGKSQAKLQQTKNINLLEAPAKRPTQVPYTETDSSDSEQGEQEEQEVPPKTEMDAIKEASWFVLVLLYRVDSSYYRC